MIWLRSLVFNCAFYLWTALCVLLTATTPCVPRTKRFFPPYLWSQGTQRLLSLVGLSVEVRGRTHMLLAPCLYASKHQSAWETTIFFGLLGPLAAVVKQEIEWIPILGWYLKRSGHIFVDRQGGDVALRHMVRSAKVALAENRPLLIFPEGTRVPVNSTKDYLPGVYGLYSLLNVPVVPVALNSGVFWPRRSFMRKSGVIVVEFLPAIPVGLSRPEFMSKLQSSIEAATERLVAEAQRGRS